MGGKRERAATLPELPRAAVGGGLRTDQLVRSFRGQCVLDHVDLHVDPGEIVVLLGPNGAGKTTLIRILATTVLPDAGNAWVAGHDVVGQPLSARRNLGLMLSEDRSFFWRLSGAQNLEFYARLRGFGHVRARRHAKEVLAEVGLSDVGDRRVDRMSSGMRARLGLARALIGWPPVLLLDEPTRSVDAVAAVDLRTLVQNLARDDRRAILFTTHDLHEAAGIASRTLVLSRGRVVTELPGGATASQLEGALVTAVTSEGP